MSMNSSNQRRARGRVYSLVRRAVVRTVWILWPRLPYRVAQRRTRLTARRALNNPAVMADARQQMEHLLGAVGRSDEVDGAAAAYVLHWVKDDELRWHPGRITRQRVVGIENLHAARSLGKGVVLNFVHHAHFAGAFASVARRGVRVKVVAANLAFPSPRFIQHLRIVGMGGGLLRASRGMDGMIEELARGAVVAVAIDVPGGSEAVFAGRRVRCSSGAAHAAFRAGAPVVTLTSHHDADGVFVRLGEPIFPGRFNNAAELLAELVRRHESAILEWPEATYLPTTCWVPLDD